MPTDLRVLGFAIVVSLGAAVVSGLAPALQASRPNLVPALKAGGHGASGRTAAAAQRLPGGQIAMSLLLVLTAGLFLRALGRASASIRASIRPTSTS